MVEHTATRSEQGQDLSAPSTTYPKIALFAATLAAAGLPLYVHLPRYATIELGLSLSTLGAILLGIRIMDFVQDPLLGRLADGPARRRRWLAALGTAGLTVGFLALFAVEPLFRTETWLVLLLVLIFTSYSQLTILFYAQGADWAARISGHEHYRLAGYREAGTLVGIILATALPSLLELAGRPDTAYRDFAWVVAALACTAGLFLIGFWQDGRGRNADPNPVLTALRVPRVRYLLILGTVNALPVAVTSTLFLFFVESRLNLPQWAGGFLLLFFLSAGLSAPIWSILARRVHFRRLLTAAMAAAIASFIWVALLPAGNPVGFALICVISGAALGADMVLLPALFSAAIARDNLPSGMAFGLWSFLAKLSLALVAGVLLPFLDLAGFVPGATNDAQAIVALTLGYAVLPCVLKCLALWLVWRMPDEFSETN